MHTPEPQGPVLVVDFGAQYAQLIARRVREAHVYSEIVPHTITAAEVAAMRPAGIILSGGPKSVNVADAPLLDPAVYELGVPVLGICYGAQLIARQLGGEVSNTGRGEYGRTALDLTSHGPAPSVLFGSVPPRVRRVDEPLRRHRASAARIPADGVDRRLAGRGPGGLRRGGSTACSSIRRWRTPTAARPC